MKVLLKSYALLFGITLLLRFLDIARNLIVASKIGVSGSADVLFALQLLPEYLVIFLGIDTLKGVANSEYSALYASGKYEEFKRSLSILLKYLIVVSFVISALLFTVRTLLVEISLPGLNEKSLSLALSISVFIFPVFFVRSVASLLLPYFNAKKKFYYPVLAQSVITIAILIFVYMPEIKNDLVYNLAIAFLIGNTVYLGILFYPLLAVDRIKIVNRLKLDDLSRNIIKNCGAILILSLVNQLFLFSRNYYASFFPEGSISALNYGATIPTFVTTLTFTIVFGVLLTNLSSSFSTGNTEEAKKIFYDTFNILVFIYIPVIIFFIVFSEKILTLVYMRGNFDLKGVGLSEKPFIWESLALFTFLTYIIPTSLFLAKKEYRYLSVAGTVSYLAGIGLSYLYTRYIGFYGVSVSVFTVSGIYGTVLFARVFRIFPGSVKEIARTVKIVLSGVVTYIVTWFVKPYFMSYFNPGNILFNLIAVLTAAFIFVCVVFFILSYIVEPGVFRKAFNMLLERIKNNKLSSFFKNKQKNDNGN